MAIIRALAVVMTLLATMVLATTGIERLLGPARCDDGTVVPPNAVNGFCLGHGGSVARGGRGLLTLVLMGFVLALIGFVRHRRQQ